MRAGRMRTGIFPRLLPRRSAPRALIAAPRPRAADLDCFGKIPPRGRCPSPAPLHLCTARASARVPFLVHPPPARAPHPFPRVALNAHASRWGPRASRPLAASARLTAPDRTEIEACARAPARADATGAPACARLRTRARLGELAPGARCSPRGCALREAGRSRAGEDAVCVSVHVREEDDDARGDRRTASSPRTAPPVSRVVRRSCV
jgi:hypothetical protein